MAMKLKFRLQATPAAPPSTSPVVREEKSAGVLDFVNINTPDEMKERATQRKIRRHVMRNLVRSRERDAELATRRLIASRASGVSPYSPSKSAGDDFFKVCPRFQRLFRAMDMVSDGLLAMTVADLSYHSQLSVGCDIDGTDLNHDQSKKRPINGIEQYTQSISLVRQSITEWQSGANRNAIIGTIICLAYLDMRVGNFRRCSMHMEGLHQVVNLCGGSEALEACPPIRQAMFVSDVLDSMVNDTHPRFMLPKDAPQLPRGTSPHCVQVLWRNFQHLGPPSLEVRESFIVLDSTLASAVQLAFLINRFFNQNVMSVNLLLPVCALAHKILSLPRIENDALLAMDSASSAKAASLCTIRELTRLSVLSMVATVMSRASGDDVYRTKYQSADSHPLLKDIDDDIWNGCEELKLWLLVSATLVEKEVTRRWFVDEIVRTMSRQSLSDWDGLVAALQKVAWMDRVFKHEMAQLRFDIQGRLAAQKNK